MGETVGRAAAALYRTDAKGNILEGNEALVRLFGFPDLASLQALGATNTYADPADRKRYLEALMAAQGKAVEQELSLRRHDGSPMWVRDVARATLDARGELAFIEGAMVDITLQHEAVLELRRSEERYRSLFSGASDILYTTDLTGRITDANATALKVYGFTREEFMQMNIREMVVPDQQELAISSFRRKLKGEEMPAYELHTKGKGGRDVWIEVNSRPLMIDGKPTGIIGIARDITEKRKAEAAYRELFERIPVGLFRADPKGQLMDANPAFVRIFGYPSRNAIVAVPSVKLWVGPGEHAEFVAGEVRHARQDGASTSIIQIRRHDGSLAWARVTIQPALDEAGKVRFLEGHLEDITLEKQAEAGLKLVQDMNRQLETATSFTEALQVAVHGLCTANGWNYGEAWYPGEGQMNLSDAFHMDGPYQKFRSLTKNMVADAGPGFVMRAAAEKRILWTGDVQREPSFHRAAAAKAAGLNTGVAAPVVCRGEIVAVLMFLHPQPRDQDFQAVQLVATVCDQLGTALARRRADDQLRKEASVLAAQFESGTDATLVISPDGTVLAANRRMCDLCGVKLSPRRPDQRAYEDFLSRVSDPERFMQQIRLMYEATNDEFVLDGRRYRRTQARLMDDDELPLGRTWYFREVSTRAGLETEKPVRSSRF